MTAKILEILFWLLLAYVNALTFIQDGPVFLRAAALLAFAVCMINVTFDRKGE